AAAAGRASTRGNGRPVPPRALQTMAQCPMAVSNNAKARSRMATQLYHAQSGAAARFLVCLHGNTQRLRDRLCAAAGNEGDLDMRLHQEVGAAHDFLVERNRSAFYFFRRGYNGKHVIHMCGLPEIDSHVTNHEDKARRFLLRLLEQRAMVRPDES